MAVKRRASFDPKSFLAKVGEGRSIDRFGKDQIVFSQGDPAEAVFYIQKGKAKVTVVSEQGKEAVVAIFGTNEFFGEGCLAGQSQRIATVTTMTDSVIMRLEKVAVVDVIHREPAFSEMFIAHLLGRTIRVEADLVDQLFNSSEKRLARLLLLLAKSGPRKRRCGYQFREAVCLFDFAAGVPPPRARWRGNAGVHALIGEHRLAGSGTSTGR